MADTIVALIYAVPEGIARILAYVDGAVPPALNTFELLLGAVTAAALFDRRRRPITALVLALATTALFLWNPSAMGGIALVIALYSVAVHHSVRASWIGLGATAVVLTLAGFMTAALFEDPWFNDVLTSVVLCLFAVLVGINIGNRVRYIGALVDRAAQLARERDQQAKLAAASERARIARDMHDIVAHSLSVMIRLADGAEAMVDKDPEASREAIQGIAATGRASLAEMRRLLGVLRDESDSAADWSPQPTLDNLPELVESYRRAGLPVTLQTIGVLPTGSGVQLAIYRSVQEALTNALRYAGHPTEVLVRLACSGAGVDLLVRDDGTGGPAQASIGAGRGLIGMGERAALYGGIVESGPLASGGWRVHVTMPQAGEDS